MSMFCQHFFRNVSLPSTRHLSCCPCKKPQETYKQRMCELNLKASNCGLTLPHKFGSQTSAQHLNPSSKLILHPASVVKFREVNACISKTAKKNHDFQTQNKSLCVYVSGVHVLTLDRFLHKYIYRYRYRYTMRSIYCICVEHMSDMLQ